MIIVTGASGQLGRAIVEQLLSRHPAGRIGVSVRKPAEVQDLAARGVRVRRGDFSEPRTLFTAFEGASQVLMVSSNAGASGGDPITQHRSAIEAAREAGVGRIVYTSHMAASPDSLFGPARDHSTTEMMLARSGLSWTALRNGFYASTIPRLLGDARETGVIALPVDGKVSWTTHGDLAEAAAVVLSNPGCFDGPTPPLTAMTALDLTDLAAIASDIYGRPVRRETISDDLFTAQIAAQGTPVAAIQVMLGLYQASRVGEFSAIDLALQRLIGRRPIEVREVLETWCTFRS